MASISLYFCPSFRETGSLSRLKNAIVEHVFLSPNELLKLSVPSVVYGIQNNMAFLALSNLDAAVYQVGMLHLTLTADPGCVPWSSVYGAVTSSSGDVSAEDPVYGPVYRPHVESLSQSAAVVLCLHAVCWCHTGTVETSRSYKGPGRSADSGNGNGCGLFGFLIRPNLSKNRQGNTFQTRFISFPFFSQVEQDPVIGFAAIAVAVLCSGFAGKHSQYVSNKCVL